jgi:chromosome segregation ATPase
MSTAGKVLTVLITLVAAAWVVLAAAVTQLNRNGAKAVEDRQKQYVAVEKENAETRVAIRKTLRDAFDQRTRTQTEVTVLQANRAGVEKALSEMRESLSRVTLQADGETTTLERARSDSAQRLAEKEAETKARADSLALVDKLKGENDQLKAQLDGLRTKFTTTLRSNKEMTDRLLQNNSAPAPTRPASATTATPGTP